jgi:hypothetical protein
MRIWQYIGLSALGALAACSGSSDPAPAPAAAAATEFEASLSMAQEVPAAILGVDVQIAAINNTPSNGTFQTPVWFGIHDGTFDIYDSGEAASLFHGDALERIAEDGNAVPLTAAFVNSGAGVAHGTIAGPSGPLGSNDGGGVTIRVDPNSETSRYFSYTSMVIPSNDAFIANGNPTAHMLFDSDGELDFTQFSVAGDEVLDAGTEVNDEIDVNTAFFGQSTPDTGTAQASTVALHTGFIAPGGGGILDDLMFANANFLALNYQTLLFSANVTDDSPVPPSGSATFVLRQDGITLDYTISASNLSGPLTAVHFHNGPAGEAGPVVFDISSKIVQNGASATIADNLTLTEEQLADLRAGNYYVNLHTALNGAGEIRGQVNTAN